MPRPPDNLDSIVPRLRALQDRGDRATLAHLRHGAGKPFGSAPDRDSWVLASLDATTPDTDIEAACLVASLFAIHPSAKGPGTLGASFRQLSFNSKTEQSAQRRFVAILNSNIADLPEHLRHAVRLLKSHEIGIDYAQLLHDLRRWTHPDRSVHRRWSRDFWAGRESPDANASAPSNPESADAPTP